MDTALVYWPPMAKQKSLPDWLKTALAVVLPMAALIGWIVVNHIPALMEPVKSDVTGLKTDVSILRGDIASLRSDIGRLDSRIDGFFGDALKDILQKRSGVDVQSNLQLASSLIRSAKTNGIQLPSDDAIALGKKLVDIQSTAPSVAAWRTISDLVNYRSVLTVRIPQPSATPCLGKFTNIVDGFVVDGDFENCTQLLDGLNYQRTTFRRALIKYSGGTLSLRDVRFENCLFDFDINQLPTGDGEKLGKTVLIAMDMGHIAP